MKKFISTITTIALALSIPASCMAAETPEMLISPAPALEYKIIINEKPVEIKTIVENGCIMVPLREISEALGFTVTWNQENKSVHTDDGIMETNLVIGENNYYAASVTADGMTAPTALGSAPMIIDGSTYVPIEMYKMLFGNRDDAVVIKDDTISIISDSETPENNVQIPAPFKECSSLDEVSQIVGFKFKVPSVLPDGYKQDAMLAFDDGMADIRYTEGENGISYRICKSSKDLNGDISGDYNEYSNIRKVDIEGISVTFKGNDATVNTAIWERDGMAYSIYSTAGLTEVKITEIIKGTF